MVSRLEQCEPCARQNPKLILVVQNCDSATDMGFDKVCCLFAGNCNNAASSGLTVLQLTAWLSSTWHAALNQISQTVHSPVATDQQQHKADGQAAELQQHTARGLDDVQYQAANQALPIISELVSMLQAQAEPKMGFTNPVAHYDVQHGVKEGIVQPEQQQQQLHTMQQPASELTRGNPSSDTFEVDIWQQGLSTSVQVPAPSCSQQQVVQQPCQAAATITTMGSDSCISQAGKGLLTCVTLAALMAQGWVSLILSDSAACEVAWWQAVQMFPLMQQVLQGLSQQQHESTSAVVHMHKQQAQPLATEPKLQPAATYTTPQASDFVATRSDSTQAPQSQASLCTPGATSSAGASTSEDKGSESELPPHSNGIWCNHKEQRQGAVQAQATRHIGRLVYTEEQLHDLNSGCTQWPKGLYLDNQCRHQILRTS